MHGGGWSEISITHDNLIRYFRVYHPEKLKENPDVVFVLHGGNQSMRKIFKTRAGGSQEWQTIADNKGFLLIAPNAVNVNTGDTKGNKQNWNDCRLSVEGNGSSSKADDVGFIEELIEWSHKHYQTNLNRVYLTGASNGGMMTYRLMTELGQHFTAAAVFIANQPEQTDCMQAGHPLPLMIMNATEDPLILWQGGQILNKGVILLSAEDTLKFWLKVNRLSMTAHVIYLADVDENDGSYIIKKEFNAKDKNSKDLWFYEVRGGGHTMPSIKHDVPMLARWFLGKQNKDLEAAQEAWNFMSRYSAK